MKVTSFIAAPNKFFIDHFMNAKEILLKPQFLINVQVTVLQSYYHHDHNSVIILKTSYVPPLHLLRLQHVKRLGPK